MPFPFEQGFKRGGVCRLVKKTLAECENTEYTKCGGSENMSTENTERKELRIWFNLRHYERLQRLADTMGQTTAALVRTWAMEKLVHYEVLNQQVKMGAFVDQMMVMMEKAEAEEKLRK